MVWDKREKLQYEVAFQVQMTLTSYPHTRLKDITKIAQHAMVLAVTAI